MTVPPPFDPTTPAYGMPAPAEPYPSYPPPPPGPYPYPPYPYPPAPQRTNGLAIASLVCAFLFAPLGILFGHLSLSQIKRSGEEGRGLAIAGLVIGYVITVGTIIVLILGMLLFSWAAKVVRENPEFRGAAGPSSSGSTPLPRFEPPAGLGSKCTYPATATPAAKPATPPRSGPVPTEPGVVDAEMITNDGSLGLRLDNAKSPCTVNSFVSLAQQGYFDNTECHRLTDTPTNAVLQCGDPTGTGSGGPGYRFANEYPTNQYRPFDPAAAAVGHLPAGHPGDGQLRSGHQRQPVLHRLPRLETTAHLHRLRPGRPDRNGHRGWPGFGGCQRRRG